MRGHRRLFLLLAGILLILTPAGIAEAFTGGGSGTPEDPYQIAAVADWQTLMNTSADWNKYFILTADLNFQGVTLIPVGNGTTTFTGNFDGCGHTISNATINQQSSDDVGLFGYMSGGQVRNLGLINVNIIGRGRTGGLVGRNYNGTISNCYSTGSVSGSGYYVGGLVGYNSGNGSTITNCYSTGSVKGDEKVGGLVGYNGYTDGTITSCYSTGSVTGDKEVGGLVGLHGGWITNCYSTGSVTGGVGSYYLGGLVGRNDWLFGTISNCYSTGTVAGGVGSYYLGGLVGYWSSYVLIGNCYFLITSGPDNGRGTPLTEIAMKQQSSFTDWDFDTVWGIVENTKYPFLRGVGPPEYRQKFPSDGKGMWIWNFTDEKGVISFTDFDEIIDRCKHTGIKWVAVKCGDFDNYWPDEYCDAPPGASPEKCNYDMYQILQLNGCQTLYDMVAKFHRAGLKLFGWQYVYGQKPLEQAAVANRILDAGVDGLFVDAECEFEQEYPGPDCTYWQQTAQTKAEIALTYMRAVRQAHPDKFVGLSTFGSPAGHPKFPYCEFAMYCDVIMPQVTWVDWQMSPTVAVVRMESEYTAEWKCDYPLKEIIPTGYTSNVQATKFCTGNDIIEFCKALKSKNYQIVAMYRYGTMLENDPCRHWDAYTIAFSYIKIIGSGQIDLVLRDILGREVSKERSDIQGVRYMEYDIDGDGQPNDIIVVQKRAVMQYLLFVILQAPLSQHSDALLSHLTSEPNDSYSLEVSIGGQTLVLAQNVPLAEIPTEPYEFESKLNRSDFDNDGDVELTDLATFCLHWLEQDCNYPNWCEGTDLDYSGRVNFFDFAIFAENWLWEKNPADFDMDGDVDLLDFSVLAGQWLKEPGKPSADIAPEIPDGVVDILDLAVLADYWMEGL